MPDQSLQNDPEATEQQTGNPADTSANTPKAATPESQASNVTRASEGERQQASQTIDGDPNVGDQPADGEATSTKDYNDLNLEELREELGSRSLSKSGNKPDLVKRLEQHDAEQQGGSGGGDVDLAGGSAQNLGADTTDAEPAEDTPRGAVDPTNVENGGIQRTDVGQRHAEILQGLSNERRQQQLETVQQAKQD